MRSLLFIQIAIIPFRSQLDPIHVPLIVHEYFIDIPLYSGIYNIYIQYIYIYINNVFHELNSHMDENWGYLQRNQPRCRRVAVPVLGTFTKAPQSETSRSQGKIHRRSMRNPMGNPQKMLIKSKNDVGL